MSTTNVLVLLLMLSLKLHKIDLIAVGMGEAPIAINQAIQYIEPDGKNRPVHSTSLIEE